MRLTILSRHGFSTAFRRQLSTMPQNYVKRVTLFKVAKPEDIEQVTLFDIEKYIIRNCEELTDHQGPPSLRSSQKRR
jgi:hypothetical protein